MRQYHLVVSTASVRLEATTRFFVPEGFPAVADLAVTQALVEACREKGARHHVGVTASAPGFYGAQSRHAPGFKPLHADLPGEMAPQPRDGDERALHARRDRRATRRRRLRGLRRTPDRPRDPGAGSSPGRGPRHRRWARGVRAAGVGSNAAERPLPGLASAELPGARVPPSFGDASPLLFGEPASWRDAASAAPPHRRRLSRAPTSP